MNETKELSSVWKGSKYTAGDIAQQIGMRWGSEAVKEYHPDINCFTLTGWNDRGYRVKKGEKALRSVTFIRDLEATDKLDNNGKPINKWYSYPKSVCLFFIRQVEPRKEVRTNA